MFRHVIRKKPLLAALVVIAAVFAFVFQVFQTPKVDAAYHGERLIDDAVFLNSKTMSATKIQNFLEDMGSGLSTKKYKLFCDNEQTTDAYEAIGGDCDKLYSASRIIYYASQSYGVNPQVILATMQKEQSLITSPNPTDRQLRQAMGYACPDSGGCEDGSTFPYQIDYGTWGLRKHRERANGNNNWWSPSSSWVCGTPKNYYKPSLYPRQNVRFYDGNGVKYRTYFIDNPATSALYCYTPHAYNNPKGLYGLPKFGTKGQYYTGSYNFVKNFERWFGSTRAKLSFKAMSTPRYLRLKEDIRKTNLRTGGADGAVLPENMEIYFSTRYEYDGELYVRTKADTGKKLERGIRYSDLENITPDFDPMSTPRWIEMNVSHTKIDPVTEAPLGEVIKSGEHLFFVDKVTIGGRLFLRTKYNALHDHYRVIPFDMLKRIPLKYSPLSEPRWMNLDMDKKKVHPTTNVFYGGTIPAGTNLYFSSMIRINGELMLRTRKDTKNGANLTLPYSSLRSTLDFRPMKDPRYLRLKDDVRKTNLRTGEAEGVLLTKGTKIYFTTRYKYGGKLYLRTKIDSGKQIERGIRYSDLR